MIGTELIKTPYTSQRRTPAQKTANIPNDTSLADFELQVLTSCGRNATVVNVPATNPMAIVPSIAISQAPRRAVGRFVSTLSSTPHFSTMCAPPVHKEGVVKGLRFEQRPDGHYKVILHIGSTYAPVSDETVAELKAQSLMPAERFLDLLVEKVGYSSYLKEQIIAELKSAGDPISQITVLQGEIRNL